MVKLKSDMVFFQFIVFEIYCCKFVTNFCSKFNFLSKIILDADNYCQTIKSVFTGCASVSCFQLIVQSAQPL